MSQISNIRKRSNKFVASLPVKVAQAVESVGDQIVQLNRKQLLSSKLATGAPIKPFYSKPYAKKKGFKKPNLYAGGDFQEEMFLSVNENAQTFFISSFDWKMRILINMYSVELFGIEAKNLPKAQRISIRQLAIVYNKYVYHA